MARVRSGQASASPLILSGGGIEAPQSRVANGHFRRKRESALDGGGVPPDTQRAITGRRPEDSKTLLSDCWICPYVYVVLRHSLQSIRSFSESPGCGNCQHRPDPRPASPGSQSLPTADQPRSEETYPPREPGADPGLSACPAPGIRDHRDLLQRRSRFTALLAETGQNSRETNT